MRYLKIGTIVVGSIGLIFMSASCSDRNATEDLQRLKALTALSNQHNHSQEIENQTQSKNSDIYNLELIVDSESGNEIHLDLCLEKGNKQIEDAKVKAEIKLPNGQEKTIPLNYVAEKKHYHNVLPEKIKGEYKIAIMANIGNERINRETSIQI